MPLLGAFMGAGGSGAKLSHRQDTRSRGPCTGKRPGWSCPTTLRQRPVHNSCFRGRRPTTRQLLFGWNRRDRASSWGLPAPWRSRASLSARYHHGSSSRRSPRIPWTSYSPGSSVPSTHASTRATPRGTAQPPRQLLRLRWGGGAYVLSPTTGVSGAGPLASKIKTNPQSRVRWTPRVGLTSSENTHKSCPYSRRPRTNYLKASAADLES